MSKICFSDLFGHDDTAKLLNDTGAGFETIQFSIAQNLDDFDRTLQMEQSRRAAFSNPEYVIHGPFLDLNPMAFDSRIRQVTMDRFNQAYDAAKALAASTVVFHSGMIPTVYFTQGWAERMVEFWDEFLDGKSGVNVCMENVLDREIQPFADVVAGVDHPDFGACLDVGHAYCYSSYDVDEWVCALGSAIKHVHVHDNDGTCDAHRGLGMGAVDWERIVPQVVSANPDATWTIECSKADEARSSFGLLSGLLSR